jgi:nitroimidazol reductase NimA-like FMN-containing flavoprotein (pyridoxamine 5'-phosphate oxidase superfamily)
MTVDELGEYGMDRLDDEEITGFLSARNMGVLGLPTAAEPYLLPMSYGFAGGRSLYFFYVVGADSRKADLSAGADSASFLVYSAETMFNWESVLLEGTLHELPDEKRAELEDAAIPGWRPELFQAASESEETLIYEFRIEEWAGVRHTGLPPGLAEDSGESA